MRIKQVLLTLTLLIGLQNSTVAQNISTQSTTPAYTGDIYHLSGRVGIGTSNPTSKFQIQDNFATGWFQNIKGQAINVDQIIGIKLSGGFSSEYSKWGGIATVVESTYANNTGLALYANELERLRIRSNGNVGIGTSNPTSKFQIQDNTATGWFQNIKGQAINVDEIIGIKLSGGYSSDFNRWGGIATVVESDHANNTGLALYANELERFRIGSNGNVGIGTTNPAHKLDVNGTIHAREVLVDLNFPGPDYVFEEDYDLTSLEELETYLKENKHLPEVPSAARMKEEGINVAEMEMLLLKKVEELTLHLIDLKSENEHMKLEIDSLKDKIKER